MKKISAFFATMILASSLSFAGTGSWNTGLTFTGVMIQDSDVGTVCHIGTNAALYVIVIDDAGSQAMCDYARESLMQGLTNVHVFADATNYSLSYLPTAGNSQNNPIALGLQFY
jgi:hypothetical protein